MIKAELNTGKSISGTGVSAGIAIGRAHRLAAAAFRPGAGRLESEKEIREAITSFDDAVLAAVTEVEGIAGLTGRSLNEEEEAILETQVAFLTDPQLRENVLEKINTEKKTARDAVLESIGELVEQFNQMEDEYLRARAADIADIGQRLARHLGANGEAQPDPIRKGSILVAEDISPSQAIMLDLSVIAGFATLAGGRTSHTALLARAKSIPAVVGCGAALDAVRQDDLLIVDGASGQILLNPGPETLQEYLRLQRQETVRLASHRVPRGGPAQTSDGKTVKLMLNISGPEDLDGPDAELADGVGLYRTEMLFMRGNEFPSEEKQLEQYRRVMEKAGGRPVIFRSMDIGGDKPLPYFPFPPEQNPFLGYRAIRFSLDRQDIFITQLRAVLRASAGGNAGVMFPMIGSLAECRAAKAVLERAKAGLEEEGKEFNRDIRVGIMIEIPAAAMIADLLAAEVDFFSIGTNDLCQYTLAVDRMNSNISRLYEPFHPGLLRLIRQVIGAAHRRGIEVGMCGEMAGDPLATLLLLGMGLREFSMSAPSISAIQDIVAKHSLAEARAVDEAVSALGDSAEIIAYLQPYRS